MAFMSVVFLFPTSPNPDGAAMNYAVVVLGGVLMLSVVYFYFPKYGGVHWFKGPVANVVDDGAGQESTQGDGSVRDSIKSTEKI